MCSIAFKDLPDQETVAAKHQERYKRKYHASSEDSFSGSCASGADAFRLSLAAQGLITHFGVDARGIERIRRGEGESAAEAEALRLHQTENFDVNQLDVFANTMGVMVRWFEPVVSCE